MRREAERYCSLIEGAASFERDVFAAELAESLAAILSAAAGLPDVTPTRTELPHSPPHEQFVGHFAAVQLALGEWEGYWTTLSPYGNETGTAISLPLADDLVDIWRDLKGGLLALDDGAAVQDVVWEWRFGFYSHWGRHATEALRALHARLAENGGPQGADH